MAAAGCVPWPAGDLPRREVPLPGGTDYRPVPSARGGRARAPAPRCRDTAGARRRPSPADGVPRRPPGARPATDPGHEVGEDPDPVHLLDLRSAASSSSATRSTSNRRCTASPSPHRPSGSREHPPGLSRLARERAGQDGGRPVGDHEAQRAAGPQRPTEGDHCRARIVDDLEHAVAEDQFVVPAGTTSSRASRSPCTALTRASTPASSARRRSVASASALASITVTAQPRSASGTARTPLPPPTSRTAADPHRRRRARRRAPTRRHRAAPSLSWRTAARRTVAIPRRPRGRPAGPGPGLGVLDEAGGRFAAPGQCSPGIGRRRPGQAAARAQYHGPGRSPASETQPLPQPARRVGDHVSTLDSSESTPATTPSDRVADRPRPRRPALRRRPAASSAASSDRAAAPRSGAADRRRRGGAAVHQHRCVDRTDHRGESTPPRSVPPRPQGPYPLAVGTRPARTAGSDGSSSWTTRRAPGSGAAARRGAGAVPRSATRPGRAPRQGRRAPCPRAAARRLGRQRPRARRLHLQRRR